MLTPRIGLKPLARLCRNLVTATRAGLEDRAIWRSEADRSSAAQRAILKQMSDSLGRGESVADAVRATGEYFPAMFRHMVALGDATGTLDRVYRRLAEHYEHMLATRRAIYSALSWPAIQLTSALAVIGGVIWISGALGLRNIDGGPLDMFGFGLVGNQGLAIYAAILLSAGISGVLFWQATRRGAWWTRPIQRVALKLPGVGRALETLALARFTWAMELLLDTSMDLRKALPLALDATGHDRFRQQGPRIARNIERGMTLHGAIAETGAFPRELLDAIAVGEQSGTLQETMDRQANEYRQRAAASISMLGQVFGYVVWAVVAAAIIMLIFRVARAYLEPIQKMSQPDWRL
jgi:type IV pilus assembly protein PilC